MRKEVIKAEKNKRREREVQEEEKGRRANAWQNKDRFLKSIKIWKK